MVKVAWMNLSRMTMCMPEQRNRENVREMDEKGEKMKKIERRKNNEKTWKFRVKDSEINV